MAAAEARSPLAGRRTAFVALRRLLKVGAVAAGVAGAVAVDVGVVALSSSQVVVPGLQAVLQAVVVGSQATGQGAGVPCSATGPAVSGEKAGRLSMAGMRCGMM